MEKLVIYTDGASRGNPGDAGIGVIIYDDKQNVIEKIGEYIGQTTNNIAEYTALKIALEKAVELKANKVDLYLDSELVVKQIKGEYQVKNKGLALIYREIKELLKNFKEYNINYISRTMNKEADRLANLSIDEFLE
ncbi:Bifunctional protein [Koleobacter methoxysyntrophicus]|jgi:ribonuclease HI|uniref:Bifunctional protein n=1 Tax=Koleobacter methoxysyntrophicus TaxID=2751313 RepID=A0A8A0RRY3_9FIRM|nr:ribonuclease HI family protein [Koleobacter methoxysyntrophicus]MDI3540479.1 ribonuclease [Thermosediminibacterales bacterium]MDK2901582.1 ribonuclease [Thermosediminibacterales bacterium]NPV42986.1 ribonuclease HI family protein [Bacillota bacterium]QSQ09946.1 Bifunctional protein [Koleobacter methoxysyntrophicus]